MQEAPRHIGGQIRPGQAMFESHFRGTNELCVSVVASAIVALMVLAGGAMLEPASDDSTESSATARADQQSPLVMCRDDRVGFRCIPEGS
jgi:hypothetical protein